MVDSFSLDRRIMVMMVKDKMAEMHADTNGTIIIAIDCAFEKSFIFIIVLVISEMLQGFILYNLVMTIGT